MDDALGVRGVERVGDLHADVEDQIRSRAARLESDLSAEAMPSSSSITMNRRPSAAHADVADTVQMFGWLSDEAMRASRSNRSLASGEAPSDAGRNLIATLSVREARVFSFVDDAHTAGAELPEDAVVKLMVSPIMERPIISVPRVHLRERRQI